MEEEGVNITEFESKVNKTITSRGTVAEADTGGKRWWVESGNGAGGKLDQITKVLSNSEANKDRRSLIAYIPKFSDAAVKQIIDAGGYVARDYKELARLVKQAEKGELAVLNSASALGRNFKAVTEKAILPFDFKTLDSALSSAVDLDQGKSGIKYGYIITKQDSKILIPGKSKATVLPIPGRDNQGVIIKFTPGKNGNPPYTVELMTGQAAPEGLAKELITELNLNKIFLQEIPKQRNIPKGIHDYEGVINKRNKGTISEGLKKEVYTAQAQSNTLEQPSLAEQLRAKMNAQKLALGWVDNEPSGKITAGGINDSTEKIRMLTSSLGRQNRLRQALTNQGKELELSEMQAQTVAKAAEISVANDIPKSRQSQREM